MSEAAPVVQAATEKSNVAPPPNSDISGTRDDLIAAAKESTEESPAEVVEKPAKVADTEPAPPEPEITMSAVARAIKDGKEREKKRLASKQEHEEQYSKMEQERQQMARERAQFEQHQRAMDAERAQILEAKRDISKFAEYSGKTQQEIAQELMIAGSPEHQMTIRQQAKLDALEAKLAAQESAWQQHQTMLKQQEERAKQYQAETTERSFITHSGESDKYPSLAKLPAKVRLNWGYEVANEYYEARRSQGHSHAESIAPDNLLAEYMESSLSGEASSQTAKQPNASNGKAPTSRANGPRTLSNSVASERRSSPKTHSNDISPDEMRKELVAAAKEALTST